MIAENKEQAPTWNNGLTILGKNKRLRYNKPNRYVVEIRKTYKIPNNKKQLLEGYNAATDFLTEAIEAISPKDNGHVDIVNDTENNEITENDVDQMITDLTTADVLRQDNRILDPDKDNDIMIIRMRV